MSQAETESARNGRSLVMRAAGLVGVATLVSRLLGLVREMVTLNYLGTDTVGAVAYTFAVQFPEIIFLVVAGGAMSSAFIPTFAAYFAKDDEAGGWRLFSGVVNLLTAVVLVVAVVTAVFAPNFAPLLFPKIVDQPEVLTLAVRLMRIMLMSTVIFAASGVVMSALQARQHFLLPALAPILYNLGIILGAIFIRPPEIGLAVGTVFGALAHLLIQFPALRQKGARYTAVFTFRDAGIQQVLRLMGPRVLGLSFSQLNRIVTVYLAGLNNMPFGSITALNVAFRMIILPQGILGQALGIAAFPTLSTLAAEGNYDGVRRILSDSLRLLLFLGMPMTVIFMLLRVPLIAILFERGLFSTESTQSVAWALLFYAIGLVALIMLEVINRTFYALSDTVTPLIAGAVQIGLMALLSFWFSQQLFPRWGWPALAGISLGFSLSNLLETAVLLWLLRRKMGRLDLTRFFDGVWRMLCAGGVMAVVTWGAIRPFAQSALLVQLLLGSAIGGVSYLFICWLLRVEELRQLWRFGRRRLPF